MRLVTAEGGSTSNTQAVQGSPPRFLSGLAIWASLLTPATT